MEDVFRALVPVLGPTSVLLLGFCSYLAWELKKAREWRDTQDEKRGQEFEKRIASDLEQARAMTTFATTLKVVVEALERLQDKVDKR